MRPTRLGWATAIGAIGLVVVGRVLGLAELYVAGASVATVIILSGLWVRSRKVRLKVSRTIRPTHVHAGSPSTVDVEITNRGSTTPVLRLRDPVSGTRGADLLLSPLESRGSTTIAYRLPTQRRGLVVVGPMTVEITDPFGFTRSSIVAAPIREATVFPAVDPIPSLPRTAGPDPDGGATSGALGRMGDEFAALRPYVIGDDLRRVHWLASARTDDDLLVRQDDVPWQGRICVVLDVRRATHNDMTLERAVSAAASVLRTHIDRGDHVRLVTTGGADSGFGVGPNHLLGILEYLAVVDVSRGSLGGSLERAARGGSGALVLVTGTPSDADIDTVDRVGPEVAYRRIVRFDRTVRSVTSRRTEIVGVDEHEQFAASWASATANGQTRRRSPAAGARRSPR